MKKKQNFYKRNKKFKEWGLKLKNNKQRGQLYILTVGREKRKKKQKQSNTGGNSTIINLHAPHHVEENTTVHLRRRWMARFSHRVVSHVPPERHGCHPLADVYGTRACNFSIQKLKTKHENTKMPS